MISFLGQHIEASLKFLACGLLVAFHSSVGGFDNLRVEIDFIQIAGVSHLASQQLDLQEAITKRQEIVGQIDIDARISTVECVQRQLDDFSAIGLLTDEHCTIVFRSSRSRVATRSDSSEPSIAGKNS